MAASIWEHFSVIPDPRVDRTKLHKLEDILVIARGLANKKGQTIRQEIARDLPWLYADPVRFKQILFNLWKNAAEAMTNGGSFFISTCDNVILNGRLYIEIGLRDSGSGLPTDVMQHLFQPLDPNRRPGHSGIGLSIVASLVERLDGLIKCQSTVGLGTSFTILLPLHMEEPK